MIRRLRRVLLSIRLYSHLVLRLPLRHYQSIPVDAVLDSIFYKRGYEFLWIFPRQSGKDEAVAQMCTFLLTLFHWCEAQIVHSYPTGGQLTTGIDRLEQRLGNFWLTGDWWSKSRPSRRGVGTAQVAFFSGHPLARAEGATANLLLIVNEVQDQVESVVERRFTPMRASTNATALYVGTVRTTGDYLWKKKQQLEALQAVDGYPRVFIVSPFMVGAEVPQYLEFVQSQVAIKGRQHPTVRTEYFNEPVDTAAGLFPERRRALMLGMHKRQRTPKEGESYVALVDVGGQDEQATGEGLQNPGRDYTVCTVVRLHRDPLIKIGSVYQVVDVFVDHGSRHFQMARGVPSLFDRLLAYLVSWNASVVVVDSTGVGQGIYDALKEGCKGARQIFGFDFAKSYGKARLGSDFLAVVETGRFKYFYADPSTGSGWQDEGSDAWWFFEQCKACGYELGEGLSIERGLRWGVSASARVILSDGSSVLIHDDRLLSAALVAELDRMVREGEIFVGTGESAVIRGRAESEERGAWA